MQEIRSHTSLRGLASLMVLIYHYKSVLKPALDLDKITNLFARGYVWVDLFFILSGFIMVHVYADLPGKSLVNALRFIKARFARIYPLHLTTLIFLLLWSLTFMLAGRKELLIDWYTLMLNFLAIHAWGFLNAYDWNFPSWSISAEFAAYLMFLPFCFFVRRAPVFVYTIVVCAVFGWVMFALTHDTRLGWEHIALFRCLPLFFLGASLHNFRSLALAASDLSLSVLQIGSASMILLVLSLGLNDLLLLCPFIFLVFSTQTDRGILGRFLLRRILKIWGILSFSIYMLHIPIMRFLQFFWPKLIALPLALTMTEATWSLVFAGSLLTFIVSYLSYTFFETPLRIILAPNHSSSLMQIHQQVEKPAFSP